MAECDLPNRLRYIFGKLLLVKDFLYIHLHHLRVVVFFIYFFIIHKYFFLLLAINDHTAYFKSLLLFLINNIYKSS